MNISLPHPGIIQVDAPALFAGLAQGPCRRFVERVFEAGPVHSLALDFQEGRALVAYNVRVCPPEKMLADLGEALTRDKPGPLTGRASLLCDQPDATGSVRLYRVGRLLTTFHIVVEEGESLEVQHPLFRRRADLGSDLEAVMSEVAGVTDQQYRSRLRRLRIEFDADLINREQLLLILEAAMNELSAAQKNRKPHHSMTPNAVYLATAAGGSFMWAPLNAVSAVMLVTMSYHRFLRARRKLRKKQVDLDTLLVVIAGLTLITGQYFSAALMAWFLKYWPMYQKQTHDRYRRRLLGPYRKRRCYVRLCGPQGQLDDVSLDGLRAGDEILVHAGEEVPVDGTVAHGRAAVDDQWVSGTPAPVGKKVGDEVYASSFLLAGSLRVIVTQRAPDAVADRMGTHLETSSTIEPPSVKRGVQFGDRTILPLLGLGGLGFMAGGAPAAVALLRADYHTAPSEATRLASLSAFSACLQRGVVAREPSVFEAFSKADTFVLDHGPDMETPALGVDRVDVFEGFRQDDVLALATAGQQWFADGRARALRGEARAWRLTIPKVRDIALSLGAGVAAGRADIPADGGSFLTLNGKAAGRHFQTIIRCQPDDPATPILVGMDGRLAGSVTFRATSQPEVARLARGLHGRSAGDLVLMSEGDPEGVRGLANRMEVDFFHAGLSPARKALAIQELRDRGRKVCLIGSSHTPEALAQQADLCVMMHPSVEWDQHQADLTMLHQRWSTLLEVYDSAVEHDRCVDLGYWLTVPPNVLSSLGVVFGGFTSLHVVLLSNLGTWVAMQANAWPLRRAWKGLSGRHRQLREMAHHAAELYEATAN